MVSDNTSEVQKKFKSMHATSRSRAYIGAAGAENHFCCAENHLVLMMDDECVCPLLSRARVSAISKRTCSAERAWARLKRRSGDGSQTWASDAKRPSDVHRHITKQPNRIALTEIASFLLL